MEPLVLFCGRTKEEDSMKKFPVLLTALLLMIVLPACALAEETGLTQPSSLAAIGVLLAAMLVGLYFSAKRVKWNAAMIAKAAICVALAYILSVIKIFRMPMGGSVTLISLYPLITCFKYGAISSANMSGEKKGLVLKQ